MPGPLDGLRVVELAQGWSGPFCGMELGDLGADVIKVEPLEGDLTRGLGPRFAHGEAIPFLALNRSKRGIAIDLDQEQGVTVLRRLIDWADVLIESPLPGAPARPGLDAESLRGSHPSLVHGVVTPFGNEGPYSDWAGSELVVQAMSGFPALLGEAGAPPVVLGGGQASLYAGEYLFIGILGALMSRARTAQGQSVHTSVLAGLVGQPMAYVSEDFQYEDDPSPEAAAPPAPRASGAPLRGLKTKDMAIDFTFYVSGYIPNDDAWREFFERMGAPELAADPRFATEPDRVNNKQEFDATLEALFADKDVYEIMDVILELGGMAAPYHTVEAMAKHPQAVANDMVIEVTHPLVGELRMIGMPSRFLGTPAEVTLPPPTLGQHSIDVLEELAFTRTEIEELLVGGVI